MSRFIRYLNSDGEWEYASVKSVGNLSDLKTSNKTDLVSAINSLVEDGILEVIQGELEAIETIVEGHTDTIENQGSLIEAVENSTGEIKEVQENLLRSEAELRSSIDQALADIITKADLDYVDGKLVQKVDQDAYKREYDKVIADLSSKVNMEEFQSRYSALLEEVSKKASSIDFETIVDGINQDILNQTIETDNAKTDIINLDSKVDTVKTDIVNTIDTVKGEVSALDDELEKAKSSLNDKIASDIKGVNETISDISEDLSTAKQGLEETKTSLFDTKSELDSVKNNIVYKVEIVSANGSVFKNGQFETVLEARVYHGSKDITAEIDATKFRWTRTSSDKSSDVSWNTANIGGTKTISITKEDVKVRATFNCELLD